MKNELPKRKPTRLKQYDYSQNGYYFITICTKNKENILSSIVGDGVTDAEIKLSALGEIVSRELKNISSYYGNIKIEKYVIMPNHIHLIIQITERINPFPTKAFDISNVVGKFKAGVTRKVGNAFMHSDKTIWQRSFHDHIIRDEKDYLKIWNYIDTNPQRWQDDCFYNEP